MTGTRIAVAVDGPAGSGKSSVSRAAARELGFDYQDTGAAYRALAWLALNRGIDLDREADILTLLPDFDYDIGVDPNHYFVRVGGTPVTREIRDPAVSAVVSRVARIPAVREHLTGLFRSRIADGTRPGIITEGRDITTIVAPDAAVRVLLTASAAARTARRAAELDVSSTEAVGEQLSARDAQDLAVVDFMNAAEGVTTLDSTDLDFDETVAALVALIRAHPGSAALP
ncbi:cytidylate kinase [Cryobacterium mesophilum]|uniref:Cytidylate kinase n=1 Tax=Terrimesophilobacter mesophilus TaxID=433647 RepID=A0A4R8VA61_9MICO|nr:(d)CMP kinase [Terrimesophilobacter mesophilus]MBB5632094.1 cytidylate kinase [Terrimesophilobacter mesophilus]TFB78970.1 (d)CMP kinase [Terrimesophilobacter mesophilus]